MGVAATIPFAARIPADESQCNTLWVNQHRQKMHRQVVGSRVLIRQQPAAPPQSPEVLLLTDEMMANLPKPDKYMQCHVMYGYTFRNFFQDVADDLIDVNFSYIVIYLGTMQLGVFEVQKLHEDVSGLAAEITKNSLNSMMVFCGVVPRPMDHSRSRNRCVMFNKALQDVVTELRQQQCMNCVCLDVYSEFLDRKGQVLVDNNFQDDLFLSEAGARMLRTMWLRYLGFFPKKAAK